MAIPDSARHITEVKVSEHDTLITYLGPEQTPDGSPLAFTAEIPSAHEPHGLRIVRKMLFDMAREALATPGGPSVRSIRPAPMRPTPATTHFLEVRIGDFVRDSVAAALGHYKAGYATYERMERHLDDQAREIVWIIRTLAGQNPPRDLPAPETLRPGQVYKREPGQKADVPKVDAPAFATGGIIPGPLRPTDSNDHLAAEMEPLRTGIVSLREAIDDLTLTIHADWGHGQVDPATLSARLRAGMRRQAVNLGTARESPPRNHGSADLDDPPPIYSDSGGTAP